MLALVLSLAGLALGELPLTVTVGHQDGGVIGFQTKSNPPFFLATTSTGALVLNSSPRDTIIEWTVPANAAARGTSCVFCLLFACFTSNSGVVS